MQRLLKALQKVVGGLSASDIAAIVAEGYEPFVLPKSHPAHDAAEAKNWQYQEIPVDKIKVEGVKGNLVKWFQGEINIWDAEHADDEEPEPNHWEELEEVFVDDPQSLPIIVLEGNNGKYYLNDGHHRLAIALKHKMKKIPAIVGVNPNK